MFSSRNSIGGGGGGGGMFDDNAFNLEIEILSQSCAGIEVFPR